MMRRRWASLSITFAVLGVFALLTDYYYPHLPDRLATHFGANGMPDGWMSKAAFAQFFAAFLLFLMAMTAGLGNVLGNIPTELINLPNKDYWLAPDRREATLTVFRAYMNSIALAVGALMLALVQGIYRANLHPMPMLGAEMWILLGLFLVFILTSMVSMIRRFRLID